VYEKGAGHCRAAEFGAIKKTRQRRIVAISGIFRTTLLHLIDFLISLARRDNRAYRGTVNAK
jgi:hypothetical protein